ncbi:flagellin [Goekera deserti]|nr:flagellin [Goekera deserti]
MSIVSNVAALGAQRSLARAGDSMTRSLERLSSGQRINRAADDAAGLAIAEGLRSQVNGMARAIRNTQDGISIVRIADGALDVTTTILQRMRALTVQAANDGGLSAGARAAVQSEVTQLQQELSRVAAATTYNGTPLLDGSFDTVLQVGADVGETIPIRIGRPGSGMGADGLGVRAVSVTRAPVDLAATVFPAVSAAQGVPASGRLVLAGDHVTPGVYEASFAALGGTLTYDGKTFDLGSVDYTGAVTSTDFLTRLTAAAMPVFQTGHTPFTGSAGGLTFTGAVPGPASTAADAVRLTPTYSGHTGASGGIAVIDRAIAHVTSTRAELGALENRLEHTISRLGVAMENTAASESRIRDADMAWETTVLARNQVLTQAATAMLAQANRSAQNLLTLLG